MGKGGDMMVAGKAQPAATAAREKGVYTWAEVHQHNQRHDQWLVIDGQVYDVTRWADKHPGGSKLLYHYAGQDATEAFHAFHNDKKFVSKYMKPIHKGALASEESTPSELQTDYLNLYTKIEKLGMFNASAWFFTLIVGHIVLCEVLAYATLAYFGSGWLPYIISILFYAITQAQASWAQHDAGHLSVFKSMKWNHVLHVALMNHIKGAATHWWNHMHYQHHSKPNIINKDPDVRLEVVFAVGEEMPKRIAKKNTSKMPYDWQHCYFFVIGPPLLFPVYFQFMVFRHTLLRRRWEDLFWMLTFYCKIFTLYSPILGVWGTLCYFFVVRVLESHWFTWVSQSNHIPMEIQDDSHKPWLALQLSATCNIVGSAFNNWFTGHLNYQIEHHLFPTMPRHNLPEVAPYCRELCRKHKLRYTVKPLGTAFADIVRSLRHSGELWAHYNEAYNMH